METAITENSEISEYPRMLSAGENLIGLVKEDAGLPCLSLCAQIP